MIKELKAIIKTTEKEIEAVKNGKNPNDKEKIATLEGQIQGLEMAIEVAEQAKKCINYYL